jgi:hypothetical protein
MRRSSILGLVALWIAAIAQPTPAFGQIAADVNIGWNQGVAGPTESFPRGTTVSGGPVFATSFFIGSLVEEQRASRSGFGFVTQGVKILPGVAAYGGERYRLWHFLYEYERVLAGDRPVEIVLGCGTGVSWRHVEGDGGGCNEMFCEFENLGWVVSPGVKLVVPLRSPLSLQAGVRGDIYLKDEAALFPFESGVMFQVGFEYFHRSPDVGSP